MFNILTVAHGIPPLSLGGGEIAAYSLHRAYHQNSSVTSAVFLASHPQDATGDIVKHGSSEYLWDQCNDNYFMLAPANMNSLVRNFKELLQAYDFNIVHIHHCMNLGYEVIEAIRNFLPNAKIIFTLHEFLSICANDGQMLKADGRLCWKSGFFECRQCLNEWTIKDFWLRHRRMHHFLALADALIAPSEFLRQRYIQWGVPADKIHMLENGLRDLPRIAPRSLADGELPNRFAYFGQLIPQKGIDTLLEALLHLQASQREKLRLAVHGSRLESQPKEFRKRINKMRSILEGVVSWYGPYEPDELPQLMAEADWIAVPSKWWENSPVVIQEAFAVGRPVLTGDMGGMAEKVVNGVSGLHVGARSPLAWAEAMLSCSSDRSLWERLCVNLPKPLNAIQAAAKHIALFNRLFI